MAARQPLACRTPAGTGTRASSLSIRGAARIQQSSGPVCSVTVSGLSSAAREHGCAHNHQQKRPLFDQQFAGVHSGPLHWHVASSG
jgi:hypothetical protein